MAIQDMARAAKQASILLAAKDALDKDVALKHMAEALRSRKDAIIQANQQDLEAARAAQLAAPLLKRLKFDAAKIDDVCTGIESLIQLEDPTDQTLCATELDAGLELYKVTCPIGVVGVIFESRPDALVQISTLCLKSGNAVMLKGGSEAARTNRILTEIIRHASLDAGMPNGWIQLLETREDVAGILGLDNWIDLIVPRGSNEFVKYIMDNTNIAVLGHADGICHVFVEREANLDMAVKVAVDSKCQYVAVCNAAETLLVDRQIAPVFLPRVKDALEAQGTEVRGCAETCKLIQATPATAQDWSTEYLDLTLSIKVVDGLQEAIDFINQYGSGHTDCIVTNNPDQAAAFMNLVDSGNVFCNCSTRFSDGFRYGLGAEVGVSTNKIHARGPVGLEGLVIYKWKLMGQGQRVADYSGAQARPFTHRDLKQNCPL
ncbi:MAG: glutamate-5-semialdehyde dehydrogenase [Planctomycetes bacterium]|nr:glutamate-5-semialdehyde dehydrogenase [Planctomycetota bacterium]